MKQLIIAIAICMISSLAVAAPKKVTLKDYAYDFTKIGYEISVKGKAHYYSTGMSSNKNFTLLSDGFELRTKVDKLSRRGRKTFIEYYNTQCKKDFGADIRCFLRVAGEIELDKELRMTILASRVDFLSKSTGKVIKTFK
jgi:hypothetical protein